MDADWDRGRGPGRHPAADPELVQGVVRPASPRQPLGKQLADQAGAEIDRAGRVKVNPDLTLPGSPRGVRRR